MKRHVGRSNRIAARPCVLLVRQGQGNLDVERAMLAPMDLDPLGSETPFNVNEDEFLPSATQLHDTPTPLQLRVEHEANSQIDQTPPQSEHSGTPLQSQPTQSGLRTPARAPARRPARTSTQRSQRFRDLQPERNREHNRRADAARTPAQNQRRADAQNERRDERRQQERLTLPEAANAILHNVHVNSGSAITANSRRLAHLERGSAASSRTKVRP